MSQSLSASLLNPQVWSREVFSHCQVKDKRRSERLIKLGGQLAAHSGKSVPQSCQGDKVVQVGAYRLARNKHVSAQSIIDGGCQYTAQKASSHSCLLAIEDSTTLSYKHQVKSDVGDLGGKANSSAQGIWVHSVLLVNAHSGQTVGLVDQQTWVRPPDERGMRHQRRERAYADKESYKWQQASQEVQRRLGSLMERVISVCDREADIFEYLHFKCRQGERFIVRAAQDRAVLVESEQQDKLFDVVRRDGQAHGQIKIQIPQRGGRKGRQATLSLYSVCVTLARPRHRNKAEAASLEAIVMHAVLAEESEPGGLSWLLLTREPIATSAQVKAILRYYGLRWRIEEFHKAWKTGAGVERLRMSQGGNLLRMAAILAFIAVRLLQLRESLDDPDHAQTPCDQVLDVMEWRLLWVSTERKKQLPSQAPPLSWAYLALAKLGGFTDTKRTGKASWLTLWMGWTQLAERVQGYRLARNITLNDYDK